MEMKTSTKSFNALAPQSDPAGPDATALELPDWSGLKQHEVTMTFAEACRWNEEMLAMFPPRPDRAERRTEEQWNTPFVM